MKRRDMTGTARCLDCGAIAEHDRGPGSPLSIRHKPECPHAIVIAPQPSETVRRSLEAGWTQACDGLAALSWCRFRYRERDHGPYRLLDVHVGERRIQVSISPTGRSVRVFVDGTEA